MSESTAEAGWPRTLRVTLSVELGGRRVSQSHCEQAKAAAHAAFIASLSGHGYSFVNQRARGEYLYVGWDDES